MITKLVNQILNHLEVNPDELFEQLNYINTNDDQFDDFFNNKRDLGKVL